MKSNLHARFKTNESSESTGKWFDFGDGVKFKIKRIGGSNKVEASKAMAKHYKPYAKLIEAGRVSEQQVLDIWVNILIDCAIIDWEGIEIDGEPAEFNRNNAYKLLCDLPELVETLQEMASEKDNFIIHDEDALGN